MILVSLLPLWAGQEAAALEVGDKAPLFDANDHLGELWQANKVLKSGKFLVVYFYPAATTADPSSEPSRAKR
ncbi:MAG: hypothetical protein JSW59_04735 [Phycisphaerales bacterium]|nr:MAG: hypothetical protein JSW59_04735 [Phycisphaerales bacterium]